MNKKELVLKVVEKTELDKKSATTLVDIVFEVILEGVVENEFVQLGDLGKLEKVEKAARVAKNPQTGEPVDVPAKFAPRFKPSKKLKDTLKALEI